MNFKLSILTIALVLVVSLQQSCSPNFANDQLQTGTYTFSLSSNPQRLQCYNIPLPSNAVAPLQLAYGISNILKYQNSELGVDYSVRGHINLIKQILSFTLITNNSVTYGSLTVSYLLIGNRNDLYAGSYIADTNVLLECNSQQTAQIPIPLSTKIASIDGPAGILIFINGIRTQSWLFILRFQQPVLDLTRNQINVTVMTDTNYPIQTIFFSYLIMDLNKVGALYTYSFTTSPVPSDFSFTAIVGITNTSSQIQYAYINLNKTNTLTCSGLACPKCVSAAYCTSLGGSVLASQCLKCSQNQQYSSGIGCVCKAGFVVIGGLCKTCPSNSIYNSVSQTCIPCGINTIIANGKCFCSEGFFNISNQCQRCPPGTIYNTLSSVCSPICSGGQQFINGICSCPSGTNLINRICGVCQQGSVYNSGTSTCIKLCTDPNQILSNGQCVCKIGYQLNNRVCVPTSSKSISSLPSSSASTSQSPQSLFQLRSQQLSLPICGRNQILYEQVCYDCPANSSPTADQKCLCNPGYQPNGNIACQLIPDSSPTALFFSQNNQLGPTNTVFTATSGAGTASASSTNSGSTGNTGPSLPSQDPGLGSNSFAFASSSSFGSSSSSSGSTSGAINLGLNSGSSSGGSSSQAFSSSPSGSTFAGSNTALYQSSFGCPVGTFVQDNGCQICSSFCLGCYNANFCFSCSLDFSLSITNNSKNIVNSFCNEICGDGKRYVVQCDDGNNINGDGCSNTCSVQNGWACSGGSSSSRDTCTQSSSTISFLKNVIFINAFYQVISINKLPSTLAGNGTVGCQNCPYLVTATVRQSPYAGTSVVVTFIDGSEYQYMLAVIFPSQINNTSNFSGTLVVDVSINSLFASYFPSNQIPRAQTLTVDLSTVSIYTVNTTQTNKPIAQGAIRSTHQKSDQLQTNDDSDSKRLELISSILRQ